VTILDYLTKRRDLSAIPPPLVLTPASADRKGTSDEAGGEPSAVMETATLGAGCFWCLDAVARRTPGIVESVAGYAGGRVPPISYEYSHDPSLGHVEAVQLVFEPAVITYREVLDLFFRSHDPTTPRQDGANHGPEYHSTIFFHSPQQESVARAAVAEYESLLSRRIVTTLRPFTTFFAADFEHQNFFDANPTHPYCTFVIVPKLKKALDLP
jgi:peptide-methionine (S)-S-oxide reductase